MTKRLAILLALIAAPASGTFVFNNAPPVLIDTWGLEDALYELGSDPAYASAAYLLDAESDDLTYSITVGALPDDWSINADTGLISGTTPGVCGTFTFTERVEDPYSDGMDPDTGYIDLSSEVTIGDYVPDVEDVAEATAISTIEGTCSMTVVDGGDVCSSTIAAGNVVRTSPVIGTLVEPDTAVTYYLSTGAGCNYGRRTDIGLGLGL